MRTHKQGILLNLSTKPDLHEVMRRWEHFWNGELYDRSLVVTAVPKTGVNPRDVVNLGAMRYYHAVQGSWEARAAEIDRWLDHMCFPGDRVPCFSPDQGPDQWAAFFGAELQFIDSSKSTNWVEPVVENWEDVLPFQLDPENPTFRRMLDYAAFLARHGEGRFLVGQIDAHSNADALSALRGPENFMMDLIEDPEWVDRAMLDMRRSYKPVHEALARAGRMGGARGCTHNGFWHPRSFQIVQSDVICMLGPEPFRRFVLPALEEEMACHEGVYFHLDGPGALRHLDDVLAIPGNWILQWQPGAGQKPNWQWTDVLQKAQRAGKVVHVFGEGLDLDTLPELHRQLDPARVVYSPHVPDEEGARRIVMWLEKNC